MVIRNYKSIKDLSRNMRLIWYAAILQTLVGAVLLVMNVFEAGDIPLYVPMMLIACGSLINSAVLCECKGRLTNETGKRVNETR